MENILYEVKMYANYKDDLNKYIFDDLEIAQKFMREKWQEAINTNDFDYIKGNYSIRDSENIVREGTYFEDDYAVVEWKENGFNQWVQFNIEEVTNMINWRM